MAKASEMAGSDSGVQTAETLVEAHWTSCQRRWTAGRASARRRDEEETAMR